MNDPSTAISCIDQLSRIMIRWVGRVRPPSHLYDLPNVLRVVLPWIGFNGLVDTAFEQIRHYGTGDVAVSLPDTDLARLRRRCRASCGVPAVTPYVGQPVRIGSLPSHPMAASRTASKMCRRIGVACDISMIVPGCPSLRKYTNRPRGASPS